jgi:hypothetical protein
MGCAEVGHVRRRGKGAQDIDDYGHALSLASADKQALPQDVRRKSHAVSNSLKV